MNRLPTEDEKQRIDCFPDAPLDENGCTSRGCIWSPSDVASVPNCYINTYASSFFRSLIEHFYYIINLPRHDS